MVPVAGSAYTYSYATMGEFLAWTVGWALVLEYAIAASAVSVGWSGYFTGTILNDTFGIALPAYLTAGPLALGGAPGGFINLPAMIIALLVTWLLMIGTSESAKVNAVLVSDQAGRADRLHRADPAGGRQRQFQPVPARRHVRRLRHRGRRGRRGGDDLLRLCRLRRGLDRGRGNQEPAAQRADRPDRQPAVLHHLLHPGRGRRGRHHRRPADHGPERHSRSRPVRKSSRASARCRNMPMPWSARTRRWRTSFARSASARSATCSAMPRSWRCRRSS